MEPLEVHGQPVRRPTVCLRLCHSGSFLNASARETCFGQTFLWFKYLLEVGLKEFRYLTLSHQPVCLCAEDEKREKTETRDLCRWDTKTFYKQSINEDERGWHQWLWSLKRFHIHRCVTCLFIAAGGGEVAFFCRGQLRYFSMWGGGANGCTVPHICETGTMVVTDFIAPANGSG